MSRNPRPQRGGRGSGSPLLHGGGLVARDGLGGVHAATVAVHALEVGVAEGGEGRRPPGGVEGQELLIEEEEEQGEEGLASRNRKSVLGPTVRRTHHEEAPPLLVHVRHQVLDGLGGSGGEGTLGQGYFLGPVIRRGHAHHAVGVTEGQEVQAKNTISD